jgi:Zn-dependent peptidase ImmA (M78 family)
MASVLQLRMAKQVAEKLVQKLSITSLPVDPFSIAEKYEILVEPKPDTTDGVSGMLLRYGDLFCIMYATHIPNVGFQRFSVAHELGHYFLEGHSDHVFGGGEEHESQAGFSSTDQYEKEADHFAAGLLMPGHLFRPIALRYDPGLRTVETLAQLCCTSLTATAIRYTELTNAPVAVIMSTHQHVDFCSMSESLKHKGHFDWIKKSSPVPENTATFRFNSSPDRVIQADREVEDIDMVQWLGGNRSFAAIEEVVGLGGYGKTLTILTCPDFEEDLEAEDIDPVEENMISHYKRFSCR